MPKNVFSVNVLEVSLLCMRIVAVNLIQKRWKNLRDTFFREVKKADSAGGKKYKYYEDLLFLLTTDEELETRPPPAKKARSESEDPQRLFLLSLVDEMKKVG